jgi:hypothetical protein
MATGDTFTCCTTPMPWPTRAEDRTCPECGAVWEREPVDLGAGARIKTPATDYRCPDCGRAECTGEDCYWPDEAGIARPEGQTMRRDDDVIYHGVYRQVGGCVIVTETPDGEPTGVVNHVVKHSPTGIGWGYLGSGAADCARSLLIAALGEDAARCPTCRGTRQLVITSDGERPYDPAADADTDPELLAGCWDCDDGYRRMPYQQFKFDHVARWDNDWRMSRADILAWLARNGVNA